MGENLKMIIEYNLDFWNLKVDWLKINYSKLDIIGMYLQLSGN